MKSIPIIYQGGSYGTYLTWILTMLFTEDQLHDPFNTTTGSSHNGKNLGTMVIDQWLSNHSNHPNKPFIRVHPKTDKAMSFEDNVTSLTEYFGKSILIYPSDKTYLLCANNYVYKIWDDFWSGPFSYIDTNNLYDNFPVDRNTPLDQVPTWIIREWLSYNLFDSIQNSLDWFFPARYKNENCLILLVDDILFDLESTILKLQHFLDMPLTKDISSILSYHDKNLSLQKYLNHDELANKIVKAVDENNGSLSWCNDQLSIITESWIQQQIRNAGYDFKCDNLNQFPTNSKELIDLCS